MRILILGGIGEAVRLARRLAPVHTVTYRVVGKGRMPELPCPTRVGGFGGAKGLAAFLSENGIELLIDATHPYAAQISRNAAQAAQAASIPLWACRRPAWRPQPGDDWRGGRSRDRNTGRLHWLREAAGEQQAERRSAEGEAREGEGTEFRH